MVQGSGTASGCKFPLMFIENGRTWLQVFTVFIRGVDELPCDQLHLFFGANLSRISASYVICYGCSGDQFPTDVVFVLCFQYCSQINIFILEYMAAITNWYVFL